MDCEAGNGHEPPGAEIPRGRISLRPRWRRDYGALVAEHLGIPVPEAPAPAEEIAFPPPFHVFSRQRVARVTSALHNRTRFGAALAQAVDSDVWQKRAEYAARRVRDDDWLFEGFKESCHV